MTWKIDNASVSKLFIEEGSVIINNVNSKFDAITIGEGASFINASKTITWVSFANTFYMQGGTFADVSGATGVIAPGTFVMEMQGGTNYIDMSASTCASYTFTNLRGQAGTDSHDGTLIFKGNASIENQFFLFNNIDNFDGNFVTDGATKTYVENISNAAGEETLFTGDFYASALKASAVGGAVFQGSLSLEGVATNSNSLSINNLNFAGASHTLTNAATGDLTLYGAISLQGENQLINHGTVSFGVDADLSTVIFDLSHMELTEGIFQIFSTEGNSVDLTSLDAYANLILSLDDPFMRAEFTTTGGVKITLVEGAEKLSYQGTESSINLSADNTFLNGLAAFTPFESNDGIDFVDVVESVATTLNLDVEGAEISYITLGANREISLDASYDTTIYKVNIGSNASLSILDEKVDIKSITSTDATASLQIGSVDSAINYSLGASFSSYTGSISVMDGSSLSLTTSSHYGALHLGVGSSLTLGGDFLESNAISSTDSSAQVILKGDSFVSTANTLAAYAGSISLESGSLTILNQAASVTKLGAISLAAGTDFTWMGQSGSITSANSTITLVAHGGDSLANATDINIATGFTWQSQNASAGSRLTVTSGYVNMNIGSGEFNLRGISFGTEGDATIVKTGAGNIIFNLAYTVNTSTSDITLQITEGNVQINQAGAGGANGFAFEEIIVGSGSNFIWSTNTNGSASPVTATGKITLDGGTYLNSNTGQSDSSVTLTKINQIDVTSKGGTFHLADYRSYEVATLTGDGGTLSITGQDTTETDITFSLVSDYNGTIKNSLTNAGSLITVGTISTSADITTQFSGAIHSDGIVKQGSGTVVFDKLVLSEGAGIEVQGGTLNVGSSDLGTGGISLGSGATLQVAGGSRIDNAITVLGGGASLTTGNAGTITLTGSITYASTGSDFALDLGGSTAAFGGELSFNIGNMDISSLDSLSLLTGLANADIVLSDSFTLSSSAGNIYVESWEIINGELVAVFASGVDWTGGAGNGSWKDSSNWAGGSAPTKDAVVIGADSVSGSTIYLDVALDLSSLTIQGDQDWVLEGVSDISVSMGEIVQNGTGNLNLNFTLDADDKLSINSGSVSLGSAQNVAGEISLKAGSLSIQGGSTLSQLTASGGNLIVTDGGETSVTTTAGSTLTNLTNGTGSLSMSGITVTDATSNSGTLKLADSILGSLSGGIVEMTGTSSIATLNNVSSLSNSGDLTIGTVNGLTGSITNTGTLNFETAVSLGTVTNTGGTLNLMAGSTVTGLAGGILNITGEGNSTITTTDTLAGFSNTSVGTVTFTDVTFGSEVKKGGNVNASNMTMAAGTTNVFGVINVTDTLTYSNSGATKARMEFSQGSTINAIVIALDGSAEQVASHLIINAGTGNTSIGSVTGDVSNFNNKGTTTLTIGSDLTITGSTVSSLGTLVLKDNAGTYYDLSITSSNASMGTLDVGDVNMGAKRLTIDAGSSIHGSFSDSTQANAASIVINALAENDASSLTTINAIASDALSTLTFSSTGKLVMNSALSTTGAVSIVGTLDFQAGGTIASLTGATASLILSGAGDTTISTMSSSIASLDNSSTGTLSIGSDLSITDSLVNTGSIEVAGELSLSQTTAQGGTVSAQSLVLVGGDTEGSVTGSNSFTALSVTDSLSMGGVLNVSGALTLGATEGGAFTITITDFTAASVGKETALSVGSLVVKGGSLDFQLDASAVADLGLSVDDSYTILSSTEALDPNLNLTLNGENSIPGKEIGNVLTVDSSTNSIVISSILSGNEFDASTGDSSWSNAGNWSEGKAPSATQSALLTGNSSFTITLDGVEGVGLVASAILVDMSSKDGSAFTLESKEGTEQTLTTGQLTIAGSGGLILDENVHIDVTSDTALIEKAIGKVVIGTSESVTDEKALLQLNSGSSLTTEDLTINSDYSKEGDIIKGLNIAGGEMTVSGILSGAGKGINNDGTLNIEGTATLGNIEGTGTTTIADGASLTLANSSNSLNVGGSLGNRFENQGSLILNSSDADTAFNLNLAEGSHALGSLSAGKLNITTESEAIASVTTLNASDVSIAQGAQLSITGTGSTVNSIAGSFSIAQDADLTVGSDTTLTEFSNKGFLDLTGHTLTVGSAVEDIGRVQANALVVQGPNSMKRTVVEGRESLLYDTLTTDSITLNSLSTENWALSGGEINALGGGKIQLFLTELDKNIDQGTYKIIDSTDTSLVWNDFSIVGTDALYDILTNDKTITYLQENGELSLVIGDATGLTWDTAQNYVPGAEDTDTTIHERLDIIDANGKLASTDILDNVDGINLTTDTTINLAATDEAGDAIDYDITLNNLIGAKDTTLSLTGDGVDSDSATLSYSNGIAVVNGTIDADGVALSIKSAEGSSVHIANVKLGDASLTLSEGATATIGKVELENSTLTGEANSSIGSLIGDETSVLDGIINITGGDEKSIYEGTYNAGSSVNLENSSAQIALAAGENLSLTGTAGTATIMGASGGAINSIDTTGAHVVLGDLKDSLSVTNGVSMEGGSLSLNIDASSDSMVSVFGEGNVTLSDTTLNIGQIEGSEIPTGGSATDNILLQITTGDLTLIGTNTVVFTGDLAKYYVNGVIHADGSITADRNTEIYNMLAVTANGLAGSQLLNAAFIHIDPQNTVVENGDEDEDPVYVYKDLKMVMDELDKYLSTGKGNAAADALAAAVAGSTTTSLGSAMMGDVERQLRSMRNRTKSMGVDPSVVNNNLPYVNAWMSAEGASSDLDSDATAAGHKLNNYGGSLGVDLDFTDKFSMGASFTALYGDLDSNTTFDRAQGDFDTMYGSVYARIASKRWTHSIVATYGSVDASLDRTVTVGSGSYTTKGETDGYGLGLMYEVGYTYALNDEATTCLQPVFNMALVHSSISGYEESRSDAALKVGDQENTYVTVGLGGLLETVVGENLYNRASILSARAMVKFDLGDRASEANVSLVNNAGYTETVTGAEPGAVGLEFGLGLTIPVTEYVGAFFMDASVEMRDGMNSMNASVGYRFEF